MANGAHLRRDILNKIILDTDPGIDDAIAIIHLLANAGDRVDCVLSSYGNISVEKTTINALKMVELCGYDIPVIKGTDKPDNDKYVEAAHIHGADGLGGLDIGKLASNAIEGDAIKMVYDRIIRHNKVDYITLGPLTNLALLIKRFPDVLEHIEQVVSMGGGMEFGNVTPHAEFNIHCDAESADFVFDKVKSLVLVPLDTTTSVTFMLPQINSLDTVDTPVARAAKKVMEANFHNCKNYGEKGSIMHDATAVMYYLDKSFFQTEQTGISVACDGEEYGKTIIKKDKSNITLTKKAQEDAILDSIMQSIKSFKQ